MIYNVAPKHFHFCFVINYCVQKMTYKIALSLMKKLEGLPPTLIALDDFAMHLTLAKS